MLRTALSLRALSAAAALLTALALVLVPGTAEAQEADARLDRARASLSLVQARLDGAAAHVEVLEDRVSALADELAQTTEQHQMGRRNLREAIAGRALAEERHVEAVALANDATLVEPAHEVAEKGARMRSAVASAGPGQGAEGLAGVVEAAKNPNESEEPVVEAEAIDQLAHLRQVRAELEAQTALAVEDQRGRVVRQRQTVEALERRIYDLEIAHSVAVAELAMAQATHESVEAHHAAARAAMGPLRNEGGAPGAGPYVWPTTGTPSSGFGPRVHPVYGSGRLHAGTDIPGPIGQPILAAANGTVIEARAMSGYGLTVVVEHTDGTRTLYAHLSELAVNQEQEVEQGERIGSLGNTGVSTGAHLHFEVHVDGKPVDPMQWFD